MARKQVPHGTIPQQPEAARRVLVVDDNVDSAIAMKALLEMDGHDVRVAHDGPDAIAAATAFEPDVVMLDLGLPGMDGFEIAARLREEPSLKKATLVAVTGYGRDEDVRRTREAGFGHHLTKPVGREALRALMAGARP